MAHFFLVTGESSGDRLGAILALELISQGHQVSGWGGKAMHKSGVTIHQDIEELKVMGWTDVISKIPKLSSLLSKCKKDIIAVQPDKLILIDYGSFNLRIAQWAKKEGLYITYYSPPKIWASRPGRINKLKVFCDQVIVLFPFEKKYFDSKGIDVGYFGHPFANQIIESKENHSFREKNGLDEKPILALLPGSRSAEIKNILPIFLNAVKKLSKYNICISCADGMSASIEKIIKASAIENPTIVKDDYYGLIKNTTLALVTSGTSTLEVALYKIPQIVGYKTSKLNYQIAKRIITTPFISLVNLIADKEVVPELIQNQLNTTNLRENIIRISEPSTKLTMAQEYDTIIEKLYNKNCVKDSIAAITKD